jgi:fermentation-respiration switch protein FrsA (DUF1100 family)
VIVLWLALGLLATLAVALLALHIWVFHRFLPYVIRIFQEKPLFILPFGKPVAGAEDVTLTTRDGVQLQGCYLHTAAGPRRGVILFGLEFGSNRWGCVPYCEFLREAGYDIFTFEMRGQGNSPAPPGYEPLQWVTEFELIDFETALEYLKRRPDRDERGVGFFGLSKGGGAGVITASRDPFIRCCVTDGIFGILTTMVPYMRQWILIYTKRERIVRSAPTWYFRYAARVALRRIEAARNCRYPSLADALPRLTPRPLLMIHGGADTYIKPEMARALFARAGSPSEFWLVEGAKHNQAMQIANGEYRRRVREFFDTHMGQPPVCGTTRSTPCAATCS